MEQRFRQRSDRPAAEPPTTGAVDERVQEEMRQFFSESTQILEEIVPSLKREDDQLSDTTGEIRRKIDAFFGDAGGSEMIRSERTMPIGAIDLPSRGEPARAPAPAPLGASTPPHHLPPLREAPATTPPASVRRRPAPSAAERAGVPAAAAIPARRASRAAPAAGGGKMDLKTALERLRRHGVVRDEAPTFSAASPMASVSPHVAEPPPAPPAPRPAPPPARPAPAPASREPAAFREPAPRRAPPPTAFEPPPIAFERPPERPAAPQSERRYDIPPVQLPPRPEPQARPVQRALNESSIDFELPARSAPGRAPAAADPFAPPPLPPTPMVGGGRPQMTGAGPLTSLGPLSSTETGEIPRIQPIASTQESGEGFDEIFAEVEGLVRGTLADSVQETLEEARVTEDHMRSRSRPPTTESIASKFAPPQEDDEGEEEPEEFAPSGPYDWGVAAANRPAGAWLLEEGAEDAARSQVVQKARKTGEITGIDVGGWKDDDAAEGELSARDLGRAAPEPRRRMPEPEPEPERRPAPERAPTPEPPRAEEPSTGSIAGAGATGILGRKLEAEAGRLGPMMDALVAKGIVSGKDVADDDDEFDDDDEVSVASFKDDRPRGDAMGVTPMRIVEEIRRLRRIQEILLSKGLVSEEEIEANPSADD